MRKIWFLALGLLVCLPACAPKAVIQNNMVEDTLYFGLSTPQGPVTSAQWEDFLAREVTPRFPDGLTVWDAKGQWKDAKGVIEKEPSKVLLLVHSADAKSDEAIQQIIDDYKKRFDQESVMRVTEQVRAGF